MHTTAYASEFDQVADRSTLAQLERWGTIAAAAALIGYGVSRRTTAGWCLAAGAAPLAYRGLTGHWPPGMTALLTGGADTRTALAGARGVSVRESVRLELPVDEVYRFWRRLDNLPRFMDALLSVEDLGGGRSHWVAKGPADVRVEWDAEIINEIPNKVIAWRSLPGGDVVSAGSVAFDAAREDRGTQVTVTLQYAPPAGSVGKLVASLFGREPSQTIREDLRRLKQILETGELARGAGTGGVTAGAGR
jgi:uncharacterized membrane protein